MSDTEWVRPPWSWKTFLAFDEDYKVVKTGRFQVDEGAWDNPKLVAATLQEVQYALEGTNAVRFIFTEATEEGEPDYRSV